MILRPLLMRDQRAVILGRESVVQWYQNDSP